MDQTRRGYHLLPSKEMGVKLGELFLVVVNTKPFPTQLRLILSRVNYEDPAAEYLILVGDDAIGSFQLDTRGTYVTNHGNPHLELSDHLEEIFEQLEVELAVFPDHKFQPLTFEDRALLDGYLNGHDPRKVRYNFTAGGSKEKGVIEKCFEAIKEHVREDLAKNPHPRGSYPKRPGKGRGINPRSTKGKK